MRKKAANLGQNDGKDKAGAAVPAESPDAAAGEAGEEKPVFNQIAYQNEYNRQNYDRVNLTMPKGRKEKIRLAAATRGQSVNEFINAAILAAMEAGGEITVTPIEEAGAAE